MKDYAYCLGEMLFTKYALGYLNYYIVGYQEDVDILDIASKFVYQLANNPAAYLLESQVSLVYTLIAPP